MQWAIRNRQVNKSSSQQIFKSLNQQPIHSTIFLSLSYEKS